MPATQTAPLPPGPAGRPPIDDLRVLQKGPHEFLLVAARQYGPTFRYPVGPLAVTCVNDPEGVKYVLVDNHKNYSKATFQYKLLSSITGHGLLTADGDLWLRNRRIAAPAFHRGKIAAFDEAMVEAAQGMLVRWDRKARAGAAIDVAAEMMHVALQIVGKALFSVEIGDEADDLAEATLKVLDHIVNRARTFGMMPQWLPTQANRDFKQAMGVLEGAVYETIDGHRKALPPIQDLLNQLIAAKDPESGEQMSDKQLRDESMTMLIAGHETVASALAWTWWLLAGNPEAETRLYNEVDRVLQGATPTAADLPKLPYVEMAFQEAMRLYPPAWIITRKALEEDVITGYRVPANSLVVCSPFVTHRLPALWEDPEGYCPERFAPEAAAGRHRFAYYPFGGGPRLCIGNNFAMVEAGLVIASVAQRFRLHPVPNHPVVVEPGVTLRPRHGLMMTLEPV